MVEADPLTTCVVDAGARYGMHPTWRGFGGKLSYLAFEPDEEEARRLRARPQPEGVEILSLALADKAGWRDLHITSHRGYCSFYPPETSASWFRDYRPGEGIVVSTVKVECTTIDSVAHARGVPVDFLKLDTEGTEREIIEGAADQLSRNVLGARVEVGFERHFQGQALFGEIHALLESHGFQLVNLDYFGRGLPQHRLHRTPDPMSPDDARFGRLVGTDGVWMKPWRLIRERSPPGAAALKAAAFAFQNNAADVALDILLQYRREGGAFDAFADAALFRWLRRRMVEHLGRWRVYPGPDWELAVATTEELFSIDLGAGHRYWEIIQDL